MSSSGLSSKPTALDDEWDVKDRFQVILSKSYDIGQFGNSADLDDGLETALALLSASGSAVIRVDRPSQAWWASVLKYRMEEYLLILDADSSEQAMILSTSSRQLIRNYKSDYREFHKTLSEDFDTESAVPVRQVLEDTLADLKLRYSMFTDELETSPTQIDAESIKPVQASFKVLTGKPRRVDNGTIETAEKSLTDFCEAIKETNGADSVLQAATNLSKALETVKKWRETFLAAKKAVVSTTTPSTLPGTGEANH